MSTVMRIHPDTYPLYLSGFLSYDGVTMPQSHDWDDAHIPRTDRPVRFRWCRSGYRTRRLNYVTVTYLPVG